MKNTHFAIPAVLLALCASCAATPKQLPAALDTVNVVWTTPGRDSRDSMPLGNGEVVANAWVEAKTGDLMLLVARTDALSEVSRFLKLGRVRIHFEGDPLSGAKDFRQEVKLRQGVVEISGGGLSLRVFVDGGAHVLHVTGTSTKPLLATATVESWRDRPHELAGGDLSSWTALNAPFPRIESADVFVPATNAVVWYHRNESSVVPKLMENQSISAADGAFDPLLHRTFGGKLTGIGFVAGAGREIKTAAPQTAFDLRLATHTAQTDTVATWREGLDREAEKSADAAAALARTQAWWAQFWGRSWVFAQEPKSFPANAHPLRVGVDSNGGSKFPGEIEPRTARAGAWKGGQVAAEFAAGAAQSPATFPATMPKGEPGLTLTAWIKPNALVSGRIFDKCTVASTDGFLLDTYPGNALRLIVGNRILQAPACLKAGVRQHVAATMDGDGTLALYLDGKQVAVQAGNPSSAITRGYVLQRYAQGFQGRGAYPIKFNGGFFNVEPHIGSVYMRGATPNADWRAWGDCYWWQNSRLIYHPMLACGDFDLMDPFFKLYADALPIAKARTAKYHPGAEGAYFPETMTPFGTYGGGDYGWDRKGLRPDQVISKYVGKNWNPATELTSLMLDRYDYTGDRAFLAERVLPMAEAVLRHFDTRFKKDAKGKIIIDPCQAVETYWYGVINDAPTTAGLVNITRRLCELPDALTTAEQRVFFKKMRAACPEIPVETEAGRRELAPAEKYNPRRSNCENPEIYAIWPYREVSLSRPQLLAEAKSAYAHRGAAVTTGWGAYDGSAAALLGLTDEAARYLNATCGNSHGTYRWPATWGPNYDWVPDMDNGGNLLEITNLMLLQGETGGKILLLPAWPQTWDVDFKLHAPDRTTVECKVKDGKITELKVMPETRRKDVVLPVWAQ